MLCAQLIIEGGTAIAIFIRCFVDKRGIEKELHRKLFVEFPRGLLATICVIVIRIVFGKFCILHLTLEYSI
jgi:palmitoyltransferase